MSFSKLFSKDSRGSSESSTRKMNRGREVLRGRLWMRKQKTSNKKQAAEVIVYSATHDGKQPGQIEIFEEVNKTYQKPKKVVLLTEVAQPGVQGGSPCPSPWLSSDSSPSSVVWPFQIVTKLGEVYDFFVDTPEDQKQWLKRLSLLIMFPYSPIPEEPAINPIKDSFKLKLKAKDYNADSVWAVYILPEEVGSRVNVLGTHILTLKSRVSESQPGQLSIISLADSTPIVTWDRDKMRRTGCLGNMVFVEIGRRCRGGPGLVWMYVGPKETATIRETLHMFLFKGDGRAVPISAQQQPHDPGRASFDSGFPPSYDRRGSRSSLQRSPSISTPQRQLSIDSGHHSSPLSHHPPPPVDFESHPNRQKRYRQSQYENTDIDSSESYVDDQQFTLDPESSLTDPLQDAGYIVMQPAFITGPESAMAQLQLAGGNTPRISPPHTSPPRSLHPINEDKSSDYENYPLDRDIDSEHFTYYTPSYENIEIVKKDLNLSRNPRSSTQHQNVRVVEHCPSLGHGRDNSPSPVLIPTP